MIIEVLFFSRLRDIAGASRIEREVADGTTVGDLLGKLYESYPKMRDWDTSLLTAVGLEFADRGQPLRDGDSVSVMPPVQGG